MTAMKPINPDQVILLVALLALAAVYCFVIYLGHAGTELLMMMTGVVGVMGGVSRGESRPTTVAGDLTIEKKEST